MGRSDRHTQVSCIVSRCCHAGCVAYALGTFTKKSVVVGPRTPFAQDPMFDYTYDSGDDWQDDEGGEDVDDNANLEPEEQDEEDDVEEGEFDDWLDDSDDVVAGEGDGTPVPAAIPVDGDADAPILISSGGEQPRLPMKVVKKREVQPKRVVKVVPTWRGPLWENRIGEGNEGMEGYRLQLLNGMSGLPGREDGTDEQIRQTRLIRSRTPRPNRFRSTSATLRRYRSACGRASRRS